MDRIEMTNNIFDILACNQTKNFADFINNKFKGKYVILRLLRDANKEIIAGDIASKLKVSTARVAVALKSLEKSKLIEKSKSNVDARKTVVKLTPYGVSDLEKKEVEVKNNINKIIDGLSNDELEVISGILKRVLSQKEVG